MKIIEINDYTDQLIQEMAHKAKVLPQDVVYRSVIREYVFGDKEHIELSPAALWCFLGKIEERRQDND